MDLNEIIALYGLDVILLTVLNSAISEALRRTVLKNKPKLVTAIVYGAGTVMYMIYRSIYAKNALYAFENFASVLQNGISIGTLTMLVCALIDRFFGGGNAASVTDTLVWILRGNVVSGKESECANKILGLYKALSGEQFRSAAADVVKEYAADGLSDKQAELIAALACEAAERFSAEENADGKEEEGDTPDESGEPVTT